MRVGVVGNNLYGQILARAVQVGGRAEAVAICPELGEPLEPFATENHALSEMSLTLEDKQHSQSLEGFPGVLVCFDNTLGGSA